MLSTSQDILEKLRAAHRQGLRLVLVFDYDGTLTPLVAHPRLAILDPALREVLARLAATPRVTVGVVSGRGLDDLIGMIGLPGLSYGGSTGLELELAGQRLVPAGASASRVRLDPLDAAIEARLTAYPGTWIERKPFGFTVHYRQLASDRIEALRPKPPPCWRRTPPTCMCWTDRWPSRCCRPSSTTRARHYGPSLPKAARNRRWCCMPATPPTTRRRWRWRTPWAASLWASARNRRPRRSNACPIRPP
ncbi:MAG: trehalose-phosphatase [Candidatus Competibacteraceae bacterium]